jgi:hypothetical protein
MITVFIVAMVLFLLLGIFVRSGRGQKRPRGLGVLPCPWCREAMRGGAIVCPSCGRESEKLLMHWNRTKLPRVG